MDIETLFFIIILIFSVIIHEISHGYMAEKLGDPTARMAGRLTLNPTPHIDLFGSFILPLLLIVSNAGFVFGWAKPVPYNPYNLRNQKWGPGLVAAAGPLSNLFLALVFGLGIRFGAVAGLPVAFLDICYIVVLLNVVLAVFNLIPVPPLDGSKVLATFLPYRYLRRMDALQPYGFVILLVIVFFGWGLIQPVIDAIFYLLTGMSLG